MSFLAAFTLAHVVISLVGIASGFVVMYGLLTSKPLDAWTVVFLATTLATSVSGFGFPFEHVLPSHVVGLISIVVLAVTILARYRFRLARAWRATYIVGAVMALYFNVFVLVVQLFLKVPALKAMAPTQSEPPFQLAQGAVLVLFVALGIAGVIRFRPEAARAVDRLPLRDRRQSV